MTGMTPARRRYWQDWTTAELAAAQTDDWIAVLPVAAIEQHGPHLPLVVDAAINGAIVRRALRRLDDSVPAIVLPAQQIGRSAEHVAFPGTLSLSPATLQAVWTETLEGVAETGVRKLLIFNSHGGQPEIMDLVARDLRVRRGLFVAHTSWPRLAPVDDLVPTEEARFGIHGGLVETAMMLAIDPESVHSETLDGFPSQAIGWAKENRLLAPDGPASFGWMTQDLHPSGAVGDPRGATAELGEALLDRAADGLVDLLGEIDRFAWPAGGAG